ncbi:odorant receptor 13a [Teleopsis dalmanni]|uniref:odorant receptor 13a n=1 Tax=Teleopsis dalmanni TaxID=139649 RepID=UPI0018CCD005|nr:odorant receptor 13a [Teleopsis dalmanni]
MFNPKPSKEPDFRFPFQCIWLKLNGSWPLQITSAFIPNSFATFYNFWSWYVIISVGITIYFQTAFLFNTFGDIAMTTENCCTTFMGALNFVRILHLRLNRTKFRKLIAQFVQDIWILKDSHPEIEKECQKNMNTFRIMTVLLSCLILMYCFLPLVELFTMGLDADEKPFPYKMLFPYDAHHGWRYVLTYIFTSYAGICVVTTLFAEDSIFGFFVTYTCGQFRILHKNIDTIVLDARKYIFDTVGVINPNTHILLQLEYNRRLKEIARRHSKLIEFSTRLEHFFNPILLVNFMISSILICMVGFQLVTGKDMFIGDYVKFIVYISSSLSQLYILCWNGDSLIQNSTDTARHLYACNWEGRSLIKYENEKSWSKILRTYDSLQLYPANKEFRTNLQFMILCSQRPIKITALKFSTLSLQSFRTILSTSLSYFTLLQTLYYGDKDK